MPILAEPLDIDAIHEKVAGVRYMGLGPYGRWLARFLRKRKLVRCLELGTFQGAGTAYIAGAVAHLEGAHIVTIDVHRGASEALQVEIQPEDLVRDVDEGLAELVYFIRVQAGSRAYMFNYLAGLVRGYERGLFDFVYIDAQHSFEGCLMDWSLATRIISQRGVILFDDVENLNWPGVNQVWRVLARTDDRFEEIRTPNANWGMLQRRA